MPQGTRKDGLPYSDLDPSKWREISDTVELGSLWMFGARERGNGHKFDYHGNFIPQVATQLFTRYSKERDIILDLFLGSGTSAIEAVNMNRRLIGVELKPALAEHVKSKISADKLDSDVVVLCGDSGSEDAAEQAKAALKQLDAEYAQLLMLHPPYWDIIRFSENESDISNADNLDDFLEGFKKIASNGYDLLEPGRFAGLVIGDKYSQGELVPLGFLTMQVMTDLGFKLKSIIVKNIEGNEIAKGKAGNLWKFRALNGGFYIFKHEYVIVFQKPLKTK